MAEELSEQETLESEMGAGTVNAPPAPEPVSQPEATPPATAEATAEDNDEFADVIMESINAYLTDVRSGLALSKAELKVFAMDADRQIQNLLREGSHAQGLKFVKAQLEGKLGMIALRQIMNHKREVLNIVMTVARTAIKLV